MRKPRDYDAELKALTDKARTLKDRKIRQLGELVVATGADALDLETLAGGLLAMTAVPEAGRKEMRTKGAVFFRGGADVAPGAANGGRGVAQGGGDAAAGGTGPGAS